MPALREERCELERHLEMCLLQGNTLVLSAWTFLDLGEEWLSLEVRRMLKQGLGKVELLHGLT